MDWFVKAFIKASVTWLALGVTLGLAIAIHPLWVIYRPAHLHMALLGFVAMMIYGVAYHVIPRFVGFPLHSPRAAGWHWWMSNVGLVLIVGRRRWLLRPLRHRHRRRVCRTPVCSHTIHGPRPPARC